MTGRRIGIGIVALGALLGSGCAGTGEHADESDAEIEAALVAVDVERGAKVVRTSRSTGADTPRRHGNVVHSMNVTLQATDPRRALEKARALIEAAGGRIEHASADANNGSLNAVVAGTVAAGLEEELVALGTVQNLNRDADDQTQAINETRRRLQQIELARAEVLVALRRTQDADTADGLGLLLELTHNERRNLSAQLTSWHKQTEGTQLYLSILHAADDAAPVDE
jgi:hypothetical protein